MIHSSLDWSNKEATLLHKAACLSYGYEVKKMIENIRPNITLLSKTEVSDRRNKTRYAEDVLKKINEDIDVVEEYLLVAALIG